MKRFNLREVFLFVAVAALAIGWFLDHRNLKVDQRNLKGLNERLEHEISSTFTRQQIESAGVSR
jgi:hypothetical protein